MRTDNTNRLLFILGLVLSVGAVAYAINTNGTVGGTDHPGILWCFTVYFMLVISTLIWVLECVVSCDPTDEGGRCRVICIRKFLIINDILLVLLFLCIGGHIL